MSWNEPFKAGELDSMRILILGGTGMLGHELYRYFVKKGDVWVTVRRSTNVSFGDGAFRKERLIPGIDAMQWDLVRRALDEIKPEVVLNCVGIIKQHNESQNAVLSIGLNSLLPHLLADWCALNSARLVHFSTDCVFSGKRGAYTEDDSPDARDLYGRSKLLGEVAIGPVTTIRSSIIGREIGTCHGLLEWFLSQAGRRVQGYRKAIFSGFTTPEMARVVDRILLRSDLDGVWQVASTPISKYDLLCLVRKKFGLKIEIDAFDEFYCNRSLNGERFNTATGYSPPSWECMIEELAARERIKNL